MSDNCYNAEEAKAESREQKERKANDIALMLLGIFLLLNSSSQLLKNYLENTGVHLLFIFGLLIPAAFIAVAVIFTVLFFKALIKIETFRTRNIICVILMVAFAVTYIFLGADYTKDIFGSSTTVVTRDYYCVAEELHFIDENDEHYKIKVSKETTAKLENNPESDEVSKNTYQYFKEKNITIEFYPNSMVLVKAEIE